MDFCYDRSIGQRHCLNSRRARQEKRYGKDHENIYSFSEKDKKDDSENDEAPADKSEYLIYGKIGDENEAGTDRSDEAPKRGYGIEKPHRPADITHFPGRYLDDIGGHTAEKKEREPEQKGGSAERAGAEPQGQGDFEHRLLQKRNKVDRQAREKNNDIKAGGRFIAV